MAKAKIPQTRREEAGVETQGTHKSRGQQAGTTDQDA